MAPVPKRRQFGGFTSPANGRKLVVMLHGTLSTSEKQVVNN